MKDCRMSKEEVAGHSDLSSGESDADNEGLGLVSKDDGGAKPRGEYYYWKKSYWCGSRAQGSMCLGALIAATAALLVIVVVLVIVLVRLVTHHKGNIFRGDGGNTESLSVGDVLGKEEFPWRNIRLGTSVIPETYDIHLSVNLNSFEVSGSVSISCSIQSTVSYIALHAVDMTVTDHVLHRDNGKILNHNKVLFPDNGFFIFNLTEPLEPGPIVAVLEFNYALRDDLSGLYRSSYRDASGKDQYLASTQFEPTNARKAFPCFDEPSLKANFSLQVTHASHYRAWSNMPVLNRSLPDSSRMVITRFQTSLKMSTYLVALVVSDFQCIGDSVVSISGKQVKVRNQHRYIIIF